MIHILQLAAIGLLAGLLSLGYALMGQMGMMVACPLLGIAWGSVSWFGVGRRNQKENQQPEADCKKVKRTGGDPSFDNLAFLIFTGFTAWGAWQKLPVMLLLVAVLLALTAWDLGRFSNRLQATLDEDTARRLEKSHLSRLGMALAAGGFIGGAGMLVRVPLDFGWALVLGILGILALNRFSKGLSQ